MLIESERLKEFYYNERKKLANIPIFKIEAELKILKIKGNILNTIKENLTAEKLLNRNDILDVIKEDVRNDKIKNSKVLNEIMKNIEQEKIDIANEEKKLRRNNEYNLYKYAEYLHQLEKVNAIEKELKDRSLDVEKIYKELNNERRQANRTA